MTPREMEALFTEIEILSARAAALRDHAARLSIRSGECTFRSKQLQRACIRAIETAEAILTPSPSPSPQHPD